MDSNVILSIQDIACSYGAYPVLEGISFSVGRGECMGICGPNGSGKSTLLRALSKALAPFRGTVLLEQAEVSRMSARDLARRMAFVPQDTAVDFDFSAWEIVLMGRSPHLGRLESEGAEDFRIAREAMEQTGTLHLKDRSIRTLSGGERQRVIIARALAQRPDIILLDEPTAHLDISFQFEILDLLRRLSRERAITMLIVFHDLNLAAQFCDRIVLLKGGRIYALGDPETILTAENIGHVYGSRVWVRRNPTTGRPYFISIHDPVPAAPEGRLRVLVLCGGGSGSELLGWLRQAGFSVAIGALNIGDSDQETAEMLGLSYVEEAPFSPISQEAHEESLKRVSESDVVVVAAMPFGNGNLRQLEVARAALEAGKKVYLVKGRPLSERDFCQGRATFLWESLIVLGAQEVTLEALETRLQEEQNRLDTAAVSPDRW